MRLDEYNERRKEIIATKCGAVWNAFTELEGLIYVESGRLGRKFNKKKMFF